MSFSLVRLIHLDLVSGKMVVLDMVDIFSYNQYWFLSVQLSPR